MRAYEFVTLPVRLGVQPIKWVGGMVVSHATATARTNVLDVWRRPWEQEVEEHFLDAKRQRDFTRQDEQRSLLKCIHQYSPRTAEEFEELTTSAKQKLQESQLDDILGPTAGPPAED